MNQTDEQLVQDLEYIAARTFGVQGDLERAAVLRAAAARLRSLGTKNTRLNKLLARAVGWLAKKHYSCEACVREWLSNEENW